MISEVALPSPSLLQSFQTPLGSISVFDSAAQIEPHLRQSAFERRCKDFRYYELLERTLHAQFDQRYFLLRNARTAEIAIQPFFLVEQDVAAGLPAHLRRLIVVIRKKWPRFLRMRMLMAGCSAGEGHLDIEEPWAVELLHLALELYTPHSKASVVLLKDFPSSYRELLKPFSNNGYQRVPSMPAAKLELSFASFEEYMQKRLGKVFRKNLRRKFKALAGAEPIEMKVVSDVSPFVEKIHALYLQTFQRSEFRFEELTPAYFEALGNSMGERVRYFLWYQGERLIAFNLCMIHEATLYDLDVGMDYRVALELGMYFVTWRDVIRWCLENGIRTYHTGPLNYDPKLHLRLDLAPHDLYARHVSRLINPLFKVATRFLQPVRHDPILARFRNAHEME